MSVYPFTNENVESYNQIYNFQNARVLSVIGSGDQYFTSILNGAKEVELFDKNKYTIYYFILKLVAIRTFSYEAFWDYMIINIDNIYQNRKLIEKLKQHLPKEVYTFFYKILFRDKEPISQILFMTQMYDLNFFYKKHYDKGNFIPYFDKNEYYRLQHILKSKKFPNIYNQNFLTLPSLVKDLDYDLILSSNIMTWIYGNCPSESDIRNYFDTIKDFNFKEMQANYIWGIDKNFLDEFRPIYEESGFIPTFVTSTNEYKKYDCVLSLRRVK